MLPNSLLIVDYAIGHSHHTGSIHDSSVFCSTHLFQQHKQIFTPGEWAWVDSAYPAESWCVPPFKKPVASELTLNQKNYNYYMSKVCSLIA